MNIQEILVYISLGVAIGFLITKFIWKPKSKKKSGCDKDDCGCH